jgi:hypothetical protein
MGKGLTYGKLLLFSILTTLISAAVLTTVAYAYENEELGYSINLPEGWTIDASMEQLGQVMFNPPPAFYATDAFLSVIVQKNYGDTAAELAEGAKQSALRTFSNVTLLSEGPKVISSLNGYVVDYTFDQNEDQMRWTLFASVVNGKQYLFNWGALASKYSIVLPEIESATNSFQIASPTASESPSQSPVPTPLQFSVTVENKDYPIKAYTNSTVSEMTFNPTLKELKFKTSGEAGTVGYCTILVPTSLIWGELSVHKDDTLLVKNVDYNQTNYGQSNMIQIVYTQSTHSFRIVGTEAVPEFPSVAVLSLIAVSALIATLMLKKKLGLKRIGNLLSRFKWLLRRCHAIVSL